MPNILPRPKLVLPEWLARFFFKSLNFQVFKDPRSMDYYFLDKGQDKCHYINDKCHNEVMRMEVSQIAEILGGQKILHMKIERRQDLITLGQHGVTKDALLNLAKYLSFPTDLITELLPISGRTVQRYGRGKHFNRAVSEQILQIAEVVARGIEVFEDKGHFLSWMQQSNVALGNKTPLSLLNSRFGVEMVLDELGRIEHGVVS
jgi:putative toxin-antitoxin system antitoxin component (TIGR02293 family)